MKFRELSVYLQKLESITSRNEMVVVLAQLFKKVSDDEINKVIYLLQGRVAPLYESIEFNIAEKSMVKAIALAYGKDEKETKKEYKKVGDLGELAENLNQELRIKNQELRIKNKELSVSDVFKKLKEVTDAGGAGSVEKKLSILSELLKSLDGNSARFVSRIPVNKLRLGFSDMTVIDSLSWMLKGDKSLRKDIEEKYNMRPDLGFIAHSLKEGGIKGIEAVKPSVFTPILMAKAERLSSGQEILEKIGKCAVEPKFDGFRLQVHFKRDRVKIFTRNLEEVTFMYPDIEKGIREQIKEKEVILEGEAIAYNPDTNEYLPFQLTAQRKRKYDIPEMAKKIPLKYMAFDLLYLNGKNYVPEIYETRRKALTKIIKKGKTVYLAEEKIFDKGDEIENFFDECISEGLEGILAKKLDGTYEAGTRGWNWIKLKRSYSKSALNDTIDCVVMGYSFGKGKRTTFGIGAFLIGIYDEKEDKFVTIAKVGTGLTDDEWRELAKRGEKLKAKEKPPLYEVDKNLEPDVWIEPEVVVEVRADEITRSPIHTAGRIMKKSKSGSAFEVDVPGYALRFPRLERFRDDKKSSDATTLTEIEKLFKLQKK